MVSRRYNFRLQRGRDDDLISWLESLGAGERSYYIRQVLRRGLRGNTDHLPQAPAVIEDVEDVETELVKEKKVSREEAENKLDNFLNNF